MSCRIAMASVIEEYLGGHDRGGTTNQFVEDHFLALPDDPLRGGAPMWATGHQTNIWRFHHAQEEKWAVSPINGVATGTMVSWRAPKSYFSLVEVDLSAPDRTLIASFEAWLKKTRDGTKRVGSVSRADMQGWANCHAIAYIDLRQYLRFTKQRVTYARLADALFPDADVDRVERLRKVTMRAAQRLLSMQHYESLLGQLGGSGAVPDTA